MRAMCGGLICGGTLGLIITWFGTNPHYLNSGSLVALGMGILGLLAISILDLIKE